MNGLDTVAMTRRFRKRAAAVRKRNLPPLVGSARRAFIREAELDYQDYALLADSTISLDGGILTVDLRPAICDAAIRGVGHLERETLAAMENIANARPLDYLKHLPTDGNKITPRMLDSKADLQALIDDSKRWTKESILAAEGAG